MVGHMNWEAIQIMGKWPKILTTINEELDVLSKLKKTAASVEGYTKYNNGW